MIFNTYKIPLALKSGMIYTISNILIKGFVFFSTPIFTRLMSKTSYGEYCNINSWFSLLLIIVTWELYSSIGRAKYDFENEIGEYQSSILVASIVVSAINWIVLEYNIDFFEQFFDINRTYIRWMLLAIIFSSATQIILATDRMYYRYNRVIIVTWLSTGIPIICSIILAYNFDNIVLGAVIGYYGTSGIINFILSIYIFFKYRKVKYKYIKHSLLLALPLIPHVLSGIILGVSDRIFINKICGPAYTATYTIAYMVSMGANVILTSLNQAWIPWFYDMLNKDKKSLIFEYSKKYMMFFSVCCILLCLIAPELIFLLGGLQYIEAMYIIPPICFAIELQFFYTIYVNIEFYVKKTYLISIGTILATVVNVILNYCTIPIYGYTAAAYTTVVGFLCMLIFHIFIVKYKSPYYNVFSKYYMMFCLCFVLLFSGISFCLYDSTVIRYVIVVVIIGLVIRQIPMLVKLKNNKLEA